MPSAAVICNFARRPPPQAPCGHGITAGAAFFPAAAEALQFWKREFAGFPERRSVQKFFACIFLQKKLRCPVDSFFPFEKLSPGNFAARLEDARRWKDPAHPAAASFLRDVPGSNAE